MSEPENPSEKPKRAGKHLQLVAGNPGNSGGKKGRSGRPREVVRLAACMAFDKRIKFLRDVIDGKMVAEMSDRLKAMDLLGRYGGLLLTENKTTIQRPHREAVEKVRRELGLAS